MLDHFDNAFEARWYQLGKVEPITETDVRIVGIDFLQDNGGIDLQVEDEYLHLKARFFVEDWFTSKGGTPKLGRFTMTTLDESDRRRVEEFFGPDLVTEARANPTSYPVIAGFLFGRQIVIHWKF